MAKVVIFGSGQLAELAHFYLEHDSAHDVAAFTVDRAWLKNTEFKGLPLVAFEDIEGLYPPSEFRMFVPMSFKKMSHNREEKFRQAKAKGYTLISYISSRATVWPGFQHGENCFILEDNTIQPFVTVGDNCVLWSGNHIGHHSTIMDHVFITSQVVVCGCCTIGSYSFLGVNSTIRDETIVAQETLIGAGALILRDTKEFEIYKAEGTKASAVRSNQLRSISHKTRG